MNTDFGQFAGRMNKFCGMDIHPLPEGLENETVITDRPRRIHRSLSKPSYHKRIQKKWNKKHGLWVSINPLSYQFQGKLLLAPSVIDYIRREK